LDCNNNESGRIFRLGVVNFINTAPLLVPLNRQGPIKGWQIVEDTPAALNSMLKKGEIDVGLISSYAYGVDYKEYYVLKDYCISATGTVGSVVLYSRYPIYELSDRTICLTEQSATSINLLYIILEFFNGLSPVYTKGKFADFKDNRNVAAYLAIGDEALRIKRMHHSYYAYDLASIWYETTSLPFVFALWAVRRDAGLEDSLQLSILKKRLDEAYMQGAGSLDEISAMVAGRIPMPQVECLQYLKGIEFDLSRLKIKGLTHFFKLLYQMGKLSDIPEIIQV